MANFGPERYQDEYVKRREYREDMGKLTDKVNKLSESQILYMALVDAMNKNLEKIGASVEILTKNYGEWTGIKKVLLYILGSCGGISMIFFAAKESGLFRLISHY
jgi:intein-encoded DNA endonuclease-like protein